MPSHLLHFSLSLFYKITCCHISYIFLYHCVLKIIFCHITVFFSLPLIVLKITCCQISYIFLYHCSKISCCHVSDIFHCHKITLYLVGGVFCCWSISLQASLLVVVFTWSQVSGSNFPLLPLQKNFSCYFQTFKEPRNQFQGIDSISLLAQRAGTTNISLLSS